MRAKAGALPLLALLLAAAAAAAAAVPPPVAARGPADPRRSAALAEADAQGRPAYAANRLLVKLRGPGAGGGSAGAAAAGLPARLPGLKLRAGLGGGGGGGSGRRRLLHAAATVGSGEEVGLFSIRDGSSVADKLEQLRRMPEVAWASPDRLVYPRVLQGEAAAAAEALAAAYEARHAAAPRGSSDAAAAAGAAAAGGSASAGGAAGAAAAGGSASAGGAAGAAEAAGGGGGARRRLAKVAKPLQQQLLPSDPQWGEMWNLAAVDAPHAWPYGKGSKKARLCIIDSGMQQGHPDLPKPVDGWNAVPVVDANGEVLRMPAQGDRDFKAWGSSLGHGSHVTGTATALGDNGVGVTGLAWEAGLLVCRIMNETAAGAYLSSILRCANLCIGAQASVVSMSFGSVGWDDAYAEVAGLLKKAGALWVVPGGNDARTFRAGNWSNWDWEFPAGLAATKYGYDNVVAVAAVGLDGLLADYSNRGPTVMQLAAPGTYILSTLSQKEGLYGRMSGTSMATPLVAAAAAQLAAAYQASFGRLPGYRALKQALLNTTDPFPSGAKHVLTGGRLNVARAMRHLLLGDGRAPPPPAPPQAPQQAIVEWKNVVQRYPGERWVHYSDSSSFFRGLNTDSVDDCLQRCINERRCGKYIGWAPPAFTTLEDGSIVNCMLWGADAQQAKTIKNKQVESGLVTRKAVSRTLTAPPSAKRPPSPPPPLPPTAKRGL